MVENHIKTETEPFAKADEQRKVGKKDLANFVMSRSTKQLGYLLSNTWKMQAVSKKSILSLPTKKFSTVLPQIWTVHVISQRV